MHYAERLSIAEPTLLSKLTVETSSRRKKTASGMARWRLDLFWEEF